MREIGIYKTALGKTYVCHFDEENGKSISFGPLPNMAPRTHEAGSPEEASKKIAGEYGYGIMLPAD
jgi:hypothetical protein